MCDPPKNREQPSFVNGIKKKNVLTPFHTLCEEALRVLFNAYYVM